MSRSCYVSWKKIRILVSLVSLLVAGSCMAPPEPAECPSGLVCPPGSSCAANQDTCIFDSCGNGIIDNYAGEMCDDGNIIANDGCNADCTSDETCGNGVIDDQQGEVCDDGNQISGDECSADCRSSGRCGDGVVNELAGEECDDGGNSEACDADCTAASCGDGFVNPQAGEQCEPTSPGCSNSCQLTNCGDGTKDLGEDCDEGAMNTATCDNDCTFPACGDGVHNLLAGEPCDDGGNSSTCDADCTPAQCPDGVLNVAAGEECDAGRESTECDSDCTVARCGDGIVNRTAEEECDAGGQHSDICDVDCTLRECGDGVWNQIAGEECDDGNLDNTDECTVFCQDADCTDGFQNADEIDVDCGGHCGPHSCEPLQHCETSEDCTGDCVRGTCVPHSGDLVTGAIHTCAILDTGNVRCWGPGNFGRLGYGNTTPIGDNETPSSAGPVDVDGTVVQVAAGYAHTCALLDGGAVRCWGDGAYGQLGYGNTNDIGDNETPASVNTVNVGGPVIQISAGANHTCALLDTGAVRCWGYGGYGQLGYGNTDNIGDNETPSMAGDVNVGGTVIQVAAGHNHTCALLDTGNVRCWGDGAHGRLGYGHTIPIGDNEPPATAGDVDVGGTVIQATAGYAHTCALLDTGHVRCWGAGANGRLGYGNTNTIGDDEHPVSAGNVDVGGTVIQVAAGYAHTCALLDAGAVRCWGYRANGRLGYPPNTEDIGDNEAPASRGDVNVGGNVIQLSASATFRKDAYGKIIGGAHTCVVLDTDAVRCWGGGAYGQLGYGNTNDIGDNEPPASAGDVSIGGPVHPSAASVEVLEDLLDADDTQCWSDGVSGQFDRITTSYIAE
jgi:cysteine-rich repeat protein